MVKGGYTWKDGNGLFIQPYAKLSALTLEGVDYQLNGVNVHSDSYNSVLGEAGTRVGYDFAVGNATVKPSVDLAALNEFSDGNKNPVWVMSLSMPALTVQHSAWVQVYGLISQKHGSICKP